MSFKMQTVGFQPNSQIRARQPWFLIAGGENNRRIMSAFGTKRTYCSRRGMSAFGGKADMPFCAANVRL